MAKHTVPLALAAFAVGIVGDQLLRPTPWGLGAFLWTAGSIGVATVVARSSVPRHTPGFGLTLGTAVLFAAGLAWRDAETLKGWNVSVVLLALTLAALQIRGLQLVTGKVLHYAAATLGAAVAIFTGPLLWFAVDRLDGNAHQSARRRAARGIASGVLISVPLVLVFGALLMSADPIFARLVHRAFAWDFERIVSHVLMIGLLTWLAGGYFHAITNSSDLLRSLVPSNLSPKLGALEVTIPLTALTALFLAFIVVQARYLFGGEALISATADLTYAEYARHGFFEIIAVAGLVLPLLLLADWAVDESHSTGPRLFRVVATIQLALVGLIMASAMQRLRMYHGAYGLTESRFYATAVMVWIAIALGWFGLTVLRRQRHRFVFGALVAGLAVVGAVNVANPDAVIARANIARAARGLDLDVDYITRLSADAAPTLVSALPELDQEVRCAIARHLEEENTLRIGSSWLSWSFGRFRADRAVARVDITALGCTQPRHSLPE